MNIPDLNMKSLTDESIELIKSLSDQTPESMAEGLLWLLMDTDKAMDKAYNQMKLIRLLPYLCESTLKNSPYKIPSLNDGEDGPMLNYPFYKLTKDKDELKKFSEFLKCCHYWIDDIECTLKNIRDFLTLMGIYDNDYNLPQG